MQELDQKIYEKLREYYTKTTNNDMIKKQIDKDKDLYVITMFLKEIMTLERHLPRQQAQ